MKDNYRVREAGREFCIIMDSLEVHRLRSELNTLWRRVVEGETKVNTVQEQSLRVGVLSSINSINANRLRDGPLLRCLTHGDVTESPAMKMKNQVTELIQKIEDLENKIDNLSGQVCESVLKQFNIHTLGCHDLAKITRPIPSKLPEIESITNHVAYVKVQFQTLKRNGSGVYGTLQEFENELLKDINALKEVIEEEETISCHGSKPKINFRLPDTERCRERSDADSNDLARNSVGDDEVQGYKNTPECRSQPRDILPPCSLPYFKHKWDGKDHQLFVKVHGKFKTREERLGKLCRMFPYKSEQEIDDHLVAYETFLKEKEFIKKQISVWKHKKETEKKILEEKVAEERKQEEIKQQRMKQAKETKMKQERESRFKEFAEWKEELDRREGKAGCESGSNAVSQKNGELVQKFPFPSEVPLSQSYTAEERKAIAVQLKEYYERRDLEIERENLRKDEEEMLKREKFSVHHRARFLKKTESYIERKKAEKDERDRLENERAARLEKMKGSFTVNVDRNKDRLLQPTQSHLAYKSTTVDRTVPVNSVNIDSIPRLGVPSWRQGL